MTRWIKIGILVIFVAVICICAGKVFNYSFSQQSPEKVTELADSTACFAQIVTDFSYFEYDKKSDSYLLYDKSDNYVCKAVFSMPYCSGIKGFGGNVPLVVLISPEETVQGIYLLDNSETPSWINRVVASGFLDNWNGLSPIEAAEKNVDAVSGATFSSTAILKSVKLRMEEYAGSKNAVSFSLPNNFIGLICSFVFLIFAGFCFFEPKRLAKFRIVLLIASVGILGFWQGQFISIAKLSNWLVSGVNWEMEIFMLVVLVLGIIIPLFTNKTFYCMYVCPFGACQELVGKVNPKHKLTISPKIAKYLRYVRYVLLVFLAAVLCTSLDLSVEYFEPFSAFKFQYASLSVLILAGVMLIVSIFVNRPWCTYFCPTGAFFSLFVNHKAKKSAKQE